MWEFMAEGCVGIRGYLLFQEERNIKVLPPYLGRQSKWHVLSLRTWCFVVDGTADKETRELGGEGIPIEIELNK